MIVKNSMIAVLLLVTYLVPIQGTSGQPGPQRTVDGRERQVGSILLPKWERVFQAAGSRPFRSLYSVPVQLGKTADLRLLWAGDEEGFVWTSLIDAGSSAGFETKNNRSYFALSRIAVESFDRNDESTAVHVKALWFLNHHTGYALKGDKIFSSENAGFSWQLLYTVPERPDKTPATLWSIASTPSKHACVVGMYSLPEEVKDSIVICTDKPLTSGDPQWALRSIDSRVQLLHVFFTDDRYGWISGMEGTVLLTTDGGKSWTAKRISTESLFGIYFRDRKVGWAVGRKGVIYHSEDGGERWTTVIPKSGVSLSEISFRDIQFADDANGWIVGDRSTILRTVDGGMNWLLEQEPSISEGDLHSIFIADTFCWAVGGAPFSEDSPRKQYTKTIWRLRWK